MSGYTTINITRQKAVQLCIEKVTTGVTDDDLEKIMDVILDAQLYVCVVVPDHCENDDELL